MSLPRSWSCTGTCVRGLVRLCSGLPLHLSHLLLEGTSPQPRAAEPPATGPLCRFLRETRASSPCNTQVESMLFSRASNTLCQSRALFSALVICCRMLQYIFLSGSLVLSRGLWSERVFSGSRPGLLLAGQAHVCAWTSPDHSNHCSQWRRSSLPDRLLYCLTPRSEGSRRSTILGRVNKSDLALGPSLLSGFRCVSPDGLLRGLGKERAFLELGGWFCSGGKWRVSWVSSVLWDCSVFRKKKELNAFLGALAGGPFSGFSAVAGRAARHQARV